MEARGSKRSVSNLQVGKADPVPALTVPTLRSAGTGSAFLTASCSLRSLNSGGS